MNSSVVVSKITFRKVRAVSSSSGIGSRRDERHVSTFADEQPLTREITTKLDVKKD